MADIESRVDKLETKTNTIESRVEVLAVKVDDFIQEMRDFKAEMRQQNQMRANEIADLRKKHDEERAPLSQRREPNAKPL